MFKKKILKKYQKTLQKMKEKPSFTLVKELFKLLREIGVVGLHQRCERLCRDLGLVNSSKEKNQERKMIWVNSNNKNPLNLGKSPSTPLTTISEALNICDNNSSVWIY